MKNHVNIFSHAVIDCKTRNFGDDVGNEIKRIRDKFYNLHHINFTS